MFDLKKIDLEVLGRMDVDELEALRDDARALQARIQEQLEWWASPVESRLRRFFFQEGGLVFYAEAVEDGVLINPALPEKFSCTPNAERSPEERARWWDRPYVQVSTWEQLERHQREHQVYLRREGLGGAADVEAHIAQLREDWFKGWPEGKRYEVRCLDGGAWDRPTCWGMFPSLDLALACINERCQ